MMSKLRGWFQRTNPVVACQFIVGIFFVLSFSLIFGMIGLGYLVNPAAFADPPAKALSKYEVHVFDVREAMATNGIPEGWAPMLREFLEKHPELEYVDSGIAHASGGNGTINAMFVVTKKR